MVAIVSTIYLTLGSLFLFCFSFSLSLSLCRVSSLLSVSFYAWRSPSLPRVVAVVPSLSLSRLLLLSLSLFLSSTFMEGSLALLFFLWKIVLRSLSGWGCLPFPSSLGPVSVGGVPLGWVFLSLSLCLSLWRWDGWWFLSLSLSFSLFGMVVSFSLSLSLSLSAVVCLLSGDDHKPQRQREREDRIPREREIEPPVRQREIPTSHLPEGGESKRLLPKLKEKERDHP